MEKTNIIERVNTALAGTPSLEELDALLAEVRKRAGEIEFRLRDVRGGERKRVLDSGRPEDIVKLDGEVELLEAEQLQVRRCRERLRGAQEKARKAEALEFFPANLKRLDELLAAEADASAALERARGRTDRKMAELNSARTLLRGRRDLPEGTEESLRQYLELRNIRADSRGEIQPPGSLHRAQQAASALGVELPSLRPQFRASA